MIEPTSFFSGFLTAICSTAIAIYFFYRHYRKVVISADLDKLKDAGFYLIDALKDAKLSEEEKLAILNKLRDAITEETRVVRINTDEIKEVKPNEIISAIKALYPHVQVKAVSDGKYYTVSRTKWQQIIRADFIERKKYLIERYDCEDFSRSFIARVIENYQLNSVGMVWGWMSERDYHAWCFVYTSEGCILWYEPQTDELFTPTTKPSYTPAEIFL